MGWVTTGFSLYSPTMGGMDASTSSSTPARLERVVK
jgi:hypothetical protein